VPVRPPIEGLDDLGPADGVHLLHSMGDTFALTDSLDHIQPRSALIVGAGYVGLEMAEGLTTRGIQVTQVEMLPELLPTVDVELGALVHELLKHGVHVHTNSTVTRISRNASGLHVDGKTGPAKRSAGTSTSFWSSSASAPTPTSWSAPEPRPDCAAVVVDETMATGLTHVWAAGDCVVTHHRLLGTTYLPLGTTAHKQGRVAGENALGGHARYAGSLGTQVVKVFDLVAARTGLREHEAAGFAPVTSTATPDDHKAYYPGATPITIRITGDAGTGKLLGAQLVGKRGPRDLQARRHLRHRALSRHDGQRTDRTRPLLHPASRLPVERRPDGHPDLGEGASTRRRARHPQGDARTKPTLLFVCTHNAGRSALGAALARHQAGDRDTVLSAGMDPADTASAGTIASLAEIGIDDSAHVPTLLTEELVAGSSVVVAMKPGLALPQVDGVVHETWELPNPQGWDAGAIRLLRDHINERVADLIDRVIG
jgi:NADPH-dependent 2,4-dienoyl-CoA reductase/sulfur reductase-like enzyme/protein-tyrosine-phosphatase